MCHEWSKRLTTHAKGRQRLFNPNAYDSPRLWAAIRKRRIQSELKEPQPHIHRWESRALIHRKQQCTIETTTATKWTRINGQFKCLINKSLHNSLAIFEYLPRNISIACVYHYQLCVRWQIIHSGLIVYNFSSFSSEASQKWLIWTEAAALMKRTWFF